MQKKVQINIDLKSSKGRETNTILARVNLHFAQHSSVETTKRVIKRTNLRED